MRCRHVVASVASLLILSSPCAVCAGAAGLRPDARAKPAEPRKQQKPAEDPRAKLAEPWADAAKLAERRVEAEKRALFQQSEPLVFTLAADFRAVNADRDPDSTRTFPAVLTVPGEPGAPAPAPLEVTLQTRGILRLNPRTCSFVPLRINFPKKAGKDTVFAGQDRLKLVTHCENENLYDQYVLLEYLAYRIYNVLTPRSFRVRLARATYVDSARGRTIATRNAVFIEDDDDLARRMEGRSLEVPSLLFSDFDRNSLTSMMLFQYMIGNTDFSIFTLHNVRILQTPAKILYPIIWDFDISGLVNPVYAIPDPRLKIADLRERLYRGPCRSMNEYEVALAVFRAKQAEVLALIDSVPGLTEGSRRNAARYLGQFYSLLGDKNRLKRELVDKCVPKARM